MKIKHFFVLAAAALVAPFTFLSCGGGGGGGAGAGMPVLTAGQFASGAYAVRIEGTHDLIIQPEQRMTNIKWKSKTTWEYKRTIDDENSETLTVKAGQAVKVSGMLSATGAQSTYYCSMTYYLCDNDIGVISINGVEQSPQLNDAAILSALGFNAQEEVENAEGEGGGNNGQNITSLDTIELVIFLDYKTGEAVVDAKGSKFVLDEDQNAADPDDPLAGGDAGNGNGNGNGHWEDHEISKRHRRFFLQIN